VDAFNIDLANELTRGGRRSGLTFAPEGGSERLRRVINKMVTEEDLINTVAAAYSAGWRHVKLYFMCGLPTETDEDVLQIADLAKRVIETGRRVSGQRDIRCTVSIGGFVPKPHTPFQWCGQLGAEETDARLRLLREAIRADRRYASAIGFRYHDGEPGIVEGLLSSWPWPTSRWMSPGTPRANASRTRCCPGTTSTPGSTRSGSGRTGRARWTTSRWRTAGGPRATTAGYAPR